MPEHRCAFRVYYEDTDAGGVMYHARYLAFAERARTEALRSLGLSAAALAAGEGIHFAVSRATIDFRRPFRLDDEVVVSTVLAERRAASLSLRQTLSGPLGLHAEALIVLAAVRMPEGRPVRLPTDWATALDRLANSTPPERGMA